MSPPDHRPAEGGERNEFQRSYDRRRFMTSRFVRRGASYRNALNAARKLFPLAPREGLPVELLPVEDRPSRQEAA